jgi:hypothetical protein
MAGALASCLLVVVQVLASDPKLRPVALLLVHGLIWALIHGSRVKVAPPLVVMLLLVSVLRLVCIKGG